MKLNTLEMHLSAITDGVRIATPGDLQCCDTVAE